MLKEIFYLKKRNATHLALDLYIALLAGQRFVADFEKL